MNVRKRSRFESHLDSRSISHPPLHITLFSLTVDLNSPSNGKRGCQQQPGWVDNVSTVIRDPAPLNDLSSKHPGTLSGGLQLGFLATVD